MLIKSQNKKVIVNPVNISFFYIDKYDRYSHPSQHRDLDGNNFSIYADSVSIGDYKTFEEAEIALTNLENAVKTDNFYSTFQL